MHYCRFVHENLYLERELRELLEDRLYEFFLNPDDSPQSSRDRRQWQDADTSAIRDVLDRLCRTAAVEGYTRGDPDLAARAAHDAVAWCANRAEQERHDERYRTLDGLLALAPREETDFDEVARRTQALVAAFPDSEELRFVARRAGELQEQLTHRAPVDDAVVRRRYRCALHQVDAEVARLVAKRKRELLTAAFSHSFPSFVRELNEVLPKLAKAKRSLEDFFGTSDALWDREPRDWQRVRFEDLETVASQLEREESLRRLARFLGRMSRESGADRDEPVPVSYRVRDSVALGRSEIEGVTTGTDLGSLLSQELALLSDETTSLLFDKRFADAKLLLRSYKTREDVTRTETRWESGGQANPLRQGPIILCVDTSGSMAGEPERVSKVATLALTRTALSEGRRCYVIFFSTEITCIEATNLGRSIEELIGFLSGSVRGGTDVAPALRRGLELLRSKSYENADVLVVSDFRIPKIPSEIRDLIRRQQVGAGTRFHSLTVTDKPVRDPLFLFDYRWLYDTANRFAPGIAPESFRLLT